MSGRGGARLGAGRKSNAVKALARVTAEEILAQHNEIQIWSGFLNHHDVRIRLEAAKYLTDRRDGKAAQSVLLSGNPDIDAPIGVTVDL